MSVDRIDRNELVGECVRALTGCRTARLECSIANKRLEKALIRKEKAEKALDAFDKGNQEEILTMELSAKLEEAKKAKKEGRAVWLKLCYNENEAYWKWNTQKTKEERAKHG